MVKEHQYLLIGSKEGAWQNVLRAAVAEDGSVETVEPVALAAYLEQPRPILYVLDSTYVEDVPNMIRGIRKQDKRARILVVTGSPTWTRARDALIAGAVDYVKKSTDVADTRTIVKQALQKMLPP